jgi:hypothetical protein
MSSSLQTMLTRDGVQDARAYAWTTEEEEEEEERAEALRQI